MPSSVLLPSGNRRLTGLGSGWQQPPLLSASHVAKPFGASVRRRRQALCQAQGDGKPATGGTDDFWHLQRPFNLSSSSGRQALSLVPPSGQQGSSPLHGAHGLSGGMFPSALGSTSPQQQQQPRGAGELSWQQWMSYFDSVDAAAERKEQLALELKDAVRLENYCAAAHIKAELNVLESEDAVAVLRRQLDQALAEERYADAAQLRDASLAGLAGWWAGQAENDPVGHLLHITPEHSRWTGCVFRPRDIAELKVQKQDPFGRSTPRPSFGASSKPSGSPILEVFLRPEAGAGGGAAGGSGTGGYVHQAVSLRLPTSEEVEQRRKKSAQAPPLPRPPSPPPSFVVRSEVLESLQPQQRGWARDAAMPPPAMARGGEGRSPFVRLSVSIRRDGSARIAGMLPPQAAVAPPPPAPPSWEPDVEETKRILRWSAPSHSPEGLQAPPSGLSAAASGHSLRHPVDPLAFDPDSVVHLPDLGSEDVVDITSQHAMSSLDAEDGAMALLPDHGLGRGFGGLAAGGRAVGGMYQADDGLEEFYAELMRVPAEVEMLGRDQMVFHLPEDPAAAILLNSRQYGAGTEQGGVRLPMAVPGMPGPSPGSYQTPDPSLADEGTSSIEVIVPMAVGAACGASGGEMEGGAAVLSAPTDAAELAAETLNILADQVAQSMEAKVGQSAPREEIAEALREVVRRVASGEQMTSVDVLLGGACGGADMFVAQMAAANESAVAAATKTTSVFYKRLPLTQSHTDPLSGLFLGSFGPHGPELLYLSRTTVDGEEMVHATKVTGDHNVPAGLVSFKAKVGRKQKLDAREVYPEELGVTARYKGEGRVAQKNFTHARWVEGELLVFNSKGNPLTAGAELGFVWSVPGEKRFLILLNRVDLNTVGK